MPYKYNKEVIKIMLHILKGVVVVVVAWYLDLQLPVQSVLITTNIVSSNSVYSIQHYVIKFVSDLDRSMVFSGYSGFFH
jgi:hypothetical protein